MGSVVEQPVGSLDIAPYISQIFIKYKNLVAGTAISCKNSWARTLNVSISNLKEACDEIETDLRIILLRRKGLIGKDEETGLPRPARSKIAGITTFRLARAHIIHMNPDCVRCNDERVMRQEAPCFVSNHNTEFAIICGLHFIGKKYLSIPEEIRTELIYTLTRRHMNQETLGIVFETLQHIPD